MSDQTVTHATARATIAGVVLAGGAGSRFDGPTHKLLADFRGKPVARAAIDAANGAGFEQLYVVQGAVDLSDMLADLLSDRVMLITAPDWADGQSRTLQAAIAQADADGHGAIVIGLADQPLVPSSAWRAIAASRGSIVVAEFDGDRRPPVKLDRSVWPDLPTEGDFGARELIRQRPDLVSAVACSGNPIDIDTAEDLSQWS